MWIIRICHSRYSNLSPFIFNSFQMTIFVQLMRYSIFLKYILLYALFLWILIEWSRFRTLKIPNADLEIRLEWKMCSELSVQTFDPQPIKPPGEICLKSIQQCTKRSYLKILTKRMTDRWQRTVKRLSNLSAPWGSSDQVN